MRRRREFIDYLHDIRDAIEKVEQFVEGIDLQQFTLDEKTLYAVIRALEIVGEASRNVPEDIQVDHPEVPWREMVGIRNKLAHEYFGINVEVVWRTVKEDLPMLKPRIAEMIENLDS